MNLLRNPLNTISSLFLIRLVSLIIFLFCLINSDLILFEDHFDDVVALRHNVLVHLIDEEVIQEDIQLEGSYVLHLAKAILYSSHK